MNTDRSDSFPPGWTEVQLKDLAILRLGKMLDAAKQASGRQLPYLRNISLRWFEFDTDNLQTMAFEPREEAEFDLRPGDLLVCEGGEPGRCAIWTKGDSNIKFQKAIHRVRLPSAIDPKWVMYDLRRASLDGSLEEYFTGSTIKHLTGIGLARYRLRLPPLAEQRRIVAKVEAALAQVNAARQRLAKVPTLLRRFRQSILADVLRGEECSLGEVLLDLKYGTSKKCEQEKRGVPVLRIPNVSQGMVDQTDLKYAELDDKERKATELLPGDLLMIRSNGSVTLLGRAALVTEREKGFSYAGYLMRLRLDLKKVDPKYAYLALSGHSCRDQIEMPARSTSGVNNINSDEVRNLRLPLPSLAEQREIVRRVEALFALADKIEARVAAATARADKLIQATLAKAFRGELVPTEAELAELEGREFETAQALLDRIHDERNRVAQSPGRNGSRRSASVARKAELRIK